MNRITDIHMHILPGMDDGSENMDESLQLARRSAGQGVETIFATPHSWAVEHRSLQMYNAFYTLGAKMRQEDIPVRLFLGCEILCTPMNVESCIRKVDEGMFHTMGNSEYVLIEFDPDPDYCSAEDASYCVGKFLETGYIPIIAHVERYGFTSVEIVKRLKAQGARIQVNAYSIENEADESIRNMANAVLEEHLADFIGSDAHRLGHRPPVMEDGVNAIAVRYGEEYADQIFRKNPQQLLVKDCRKVITSSAWLDGVMGVVVGDALGCPVQFVPRDELQSGPVTDMEGYGTYNLPEGTWTDDSSLTLALLTSIRANQGMNLHDIMYRFESWLAGGKFTPYGIAFDMGGGTVAALTRYAKTQDVTTCGGDTEQDNGNGSLMRILPACLYAWEQKLPPEEAIRIIHAVSGLTHNHLRAKIACGLYYFCVCAVLDENGTLPERLQHGMDRGFAFYQQDIRNLTELAYYGRLRDLDTFSREPETAIRSFGYVVDTLEAAVWSLMTTGSFQECELKAVNLGGDTDTIAAIAGGLAGLYYGYKDIPAQWLSVIKRREWIEGLCRVNDEKMSTL